MQQCNAGCTRDAAGNCLLFEEEEGEGQDVGGGGQGGGELGGEGGEELREGGGGRGQCSPNLFFYSGLPPAQSICHRSDAPCPPLG